MLTKVTDPNGNSIPYSYNSQYQPTAKTDKAGRVFRYTYNSAFLPTAVYDANGTGPFTLSNPDNWATDATKLAQSQTRSYIPATTTNTDGRGNTWKYQYDANGYLVKVTYPDGHFTTYTYDPNTLQLASMTDANGNTTSYVYNSEGDLTQVTDALLHVANYTYDGTFNMMTTYDSHGNVTQYTDKNGDITKYQYDSSGNLIQETDAYGAGIHATNYAYDQLNRRTTMTDALGEETRYFYDGGMFTGSVTLGGVTVTCNLCGATPGSSLVTGQVDPDGTASLHAGTTYYHYDALDRLVITDRRTGCIGGPMGTGCSDTINTSSDAVLLYSYDPDNNRLTMTEADGNTTDYSYDAKNRLIQEVNAAGDTTDMTYDLVNNVLTVTAPNLNVTTAELGPPETYGVPLAWAFFHLYRGETEKAVDWWEKVIDQRDPNAVIAPRAWPSEALRASPRWPALAKRMNLPEAAW